MDIDEKILRELLLLPGHITGEQFEIALKFSKEQSITLEETLVEKGFISDENLGKTIADYLNYHFAALHDVHIEDKYLNLIPEIVAREQQALFFGEENDILKLATSNSDNFEFIKLLEKKTGKQIKVYYSTKTVINGALKYYRGDLRGRVKVLVDDCARNQDEGDIVSLVNLFLEYAHDSRASDIHIEPLEESVLVRFRIDGILHEATSYPKHIHEKIVFRVKIMSRLRTDESAAPQDGRFDHTLESGKFDVRVSIIPVTNGENIVMRLLSSHTEHFSLENLGLHENDLKKVMNATSKPNGMILTVGPTGSGKTTTLYTILELLNKPEVNIMTIEDPVEYDIEHVQQTQVNINKDLTFATGLRSLVRQDPDIIMVGEIRDEETADIAVNAAMTGHLLLSTLHTNDAATTFPRLVEMAVEPFLVASSVNIIIAQRLVRKICDHCRHSYVLGDSEIELLKTSVDVVGYFKEISGKDELAGLRVYKGSGCKVCGETGFSGRIGIFEVLEVTEDIRVLITRKVSSDVIDKRAKEDGMRPLVYDGIKKVLAGTTTLEEVMKTVKV